MTPERKARIIEVTTEQLRERKADQLRRLAGCTMGEECPCHRELWDALDSTLWLLGERP